jgi:hypothetical protein
MARLRGESRGLVPSDYARKTIREAEAEVDSWECTGSIAVQVMKLAQQFAQLADAHESSRLV